MRRCLDSLSKLEYFSNPLRMRINVSVNCAVDRFIYKLQNFVLPFLTTHYIVLCLKTMKGLECAPFSVRLPSGLVTRVDIWKYDTPFACMKLDSQLEICFKAYQDAHTAVYSINSALKKLFENETFNLELLRANKHESFYQNKILEKAKAILVKANRSDPKIDVTLNASLVSAI